MMFLRLALCVAALTTSAGKPKATLDGPCDPKIMVDIRQGLDEATPTERGVIVVAGLAEACESKLPKSVVGSLKAVAHASPSNRTGILEGVLTDNAAFAERACPDWKKTLAASPQDPAKRAASIFAGCNYTRFAVMTSAELEKSVQTNGFGMIAAPLYAFLIDGNMEPAEAKRLVRALLPGQPD